MASQTSIFFAMDLREQTTGVDASFNGSRPNKAICLNLLIDGLVDNWWLIHCSN